MSSIIDTTKLDQSIEQPDIVAAADKQFVKYPAGRYDVSNPHPGYGIDPNILNEFGHTKYPKWVKAPDGQDVIVNSEQEENALLGGKVEEVKEPKKEAW